MATEKKSFLLYVDVLHTVKHLNNEQAGELFKHILAYVNDEEPETENHLIKIAFEPIKQSLKRDLKKWENKQEQRIEAGRKGGLARAKKAKQNQAKQATATNPKQSQANQAVSVSVNGSVSVSDNIPSEYSEKDFLRDWNSLRVEHLKKPSFLNSISRDELEHLNDLKKQYRKIDFSNALIGLFKQKKMPNGNTTMQSNPKHFLTHFNAYLTAFHDKNNSLYGKEKTEAL